jgi:hypothetical protein
MALVKYNNNSISAVTSTGLATGSLVPIKTLTASNSATLSFLNGADSVVFDGTYPIYKFEFINMHPITNSADLGFQVDTGTNTNYNIACTSTAFQVGQAEDASETTLGYQTNDDQAQGSGFQMITQTNAGSGNDESSSGELLLFNPSSTTFVKHFISRLNTYWSGTGTFEKYAAGYFNTTTALTRVQFKMNTGNIDAGKIKLYGIKDS